MVQYRYVTYCSIGQKANRMTTGGTTALFSFPASYANANGILQYYYLLLMQKVNVGDEWLRGEWKKDR